MANTLKLRGGTTAEVAAATLAEREIMVDTTKDVIVVGPSKKEMAVGNGGTYTGNYTFSGNVNLSGATTFGTSINANSLRIQNVATPTGTSDATNKSYVDAQVTSIINTTLPGNVFSADGSVTIVDNNPGVGDIDLALTAGSVTTAKLANNSITTDKIVDNNVTGVKFANNTITTAKIADQAITSAKLAVDSVTSNRIEAGAVGTTRIADSSITALKITTDAVTTDKIQDDAVTAGKLANTSVTAGNYTAADITVDAQGRITAAASGAISTAEITDAAVTTAKIADDAITEAKIANDAVTTDRILDGAATAAKIANGAVTEAKIATGAATSAKIADANVTTAKIANANVTTAKIADLNVTTGKIANGAVTEAKIDSGVLSTHATQVTACANSATSAANSATSAATSAAAAAAAFDNFDDTYLGQKASDPTTDNDGDALTAGDLYYNTTAGVMKVYIGSSWVTAYVPGDAANISSTAVGNVAATNVQAAIQELDSEKLPVTGYTGKVGIGTTSPTSTLEVSSASNESLLGVKAASAKNCYLNIDADANRRGVIRFQSGGSTQWSIGRGDSDELAASSFHISAGSSGGNAAKLAIDSSGNVGIGDSSPSEKLDVNGNIRLTGQLFQSMPPDFWSQTTTIVELNGMGNLTHMGGYETCLTSNGYRDNNNQWKSYAINSYTGASQIKLNPQGNIVFGTESNKANGSSATLQERMRITSSGNVGIGTSSPGANLEVFASVNPQLQVNSTSHGYLDLSNYSNGAAVMTSAAHPLRLGTANTERIRIDSSGNVGIGTSSPGSPLDVAGDIEISTDNSAATQTIKFSDGTQGRGKIQYEHNGDALVFHTFSAERMRIDSSGRVGIGTSSPLSGSKLTVAGGCVAITGQNTDHGANSLRLGEEGSGLAQFRAYGPDTSTSGLFQFTCSSSNGTGTGEAMRIRSDGNIGIGTTGSSNTHFFVNGRSGLNQAIYGQANGTGSYYGVYGYSNGAANTQYGVYGQVATLSANASGGVLGYSINGNTYGIVGYWSTSAYYSFYGNGAVAGTSFPNVSDSQLKDVNSNLTGCLDKLANIQPVKYTWKENSQQRRSVGDGMEIGMLAQEVEAQFPELVSEMKWPEVNGSNPETLNEQLGTTLGVDYGRMTAVLVQALNEAKERIETLEAKVAALEAG